MSFQSLNSTLGQYIEKRIKHGITTYHKAIISINKLTIYENMDQIWTINKHYIPQKIKERQITFYNMTSEAISIKTDKWAHASLYKNLSKSRIWFKREQNIGG